MNKLLKNTSWYMMGGLLPYAINFLMLPVYTRFMSPADYGVVSLANAFGAFVQAFMGLRLGSSMQRYYFDLEGRDVKRLFSTLFFSIVTINVALLLTLHLFGEPITRLAFPRADISYRPYIAIVLATLFFNSLVGFFQIVLKVEERARTFFLASCVYMAANLLLGIYFVVYRKMGAHGFLLAAMLSAMLNAGVLTAVLWRMLIPAFSFTYVKQGLAYGLPLIPHVLGNVLFVFSDKLILGFYVSLAQIGLYNIADRIAMLLRMGVQSFNNAYSPVFFRASKEGREQAVEMTRIVINRWIALVSLVWLGLDFMSEELLFILTPASFHGAYRYVPILLMAYVFKGLYGFLADTVKFEKKTKVIPLITLSAGIINIAANLVLVPVFGVTAAAWTTLGSFVIVFLLGLYFSKRYYPLKIDWNVLLECLSFSILVFLVVSQLRGPNVWVNLCLELLGWLSLAGFLVIRNHGNIRELLLMRRGFGSSEDNGC